MLTELALRPIQPSDTTHTVPEQFWAVGDVVRKLRGERTQQWLAKEAGVEIGTVRRIELNQKYQHESLVSVATALETPLDVIYAHAGALTMTPMARQAVEWFEPLTRAQKAAYLESLRAPALSPEGLSVARRFEAADAQTKAMVLAALRRAALHTSQSPSTQSPDLPVAASGTRARGQKSRKDR